MSEAGALAGGGSDRIRPLVSAAVRGCARPGCPASASATLAFDYAARAVWLRPLETERSPGRYELCPAHADRTRQPHGWTLYDERALRRLSEAADTAAAVAHDPPVTMGHAQTVAALAAALREPPARLVASAGRAVADVATQPQPDRRLRSWSTAGPGERLPDHHGGGHATGSPPRPPDRSVGDEPEGERRARRW